MHSYIIQGTEKVIDNNLLSELANILSSETSLLVLEAKHCIKRAGGMLPVETDEQARNISSQFQKAGLDNFVLSEDLLLELPKEELLGKDWSGMEDYVGLVVVGAVGYAVEKIRHEAKLSNMRVSPITCLPNIHTMWKKETIKENQTFYSIDMLSKGRYFRRVSELLPDLMIQQLESFRRQGVYLAKNVVGLMSGQKIMKPMGSGNYSNYIKWLYQMRYARPEDLSLSGF